MTPPKSKQDTALPRNLLAEHATSQGETMTTNTQHTRPDYVKHPVEPIEGGWLLGLVEPDIRGYTPNGGFAPGTYADACDFCNDEAARRGISNEAVDATVCSSMGKSNFARALQIYLDHSATTARAAIAKAEGRK